MTFTPPEPPPAASTPPVAPTPPPAQPLPPAPYVATPQPQSKLVIGLVLGGVALLVLIGVGITVLASTLFSNVDELISSSDLGSDDGSGESEPSTGVSDNEEPISGPAQSARAASPHDCAGNGCFTDEVIASVIPSEEVFDDLHLGTVYDAYGDYDSSTPGQERRYTLESWQDQEGSPDACFFTYYSTPGIEPIVLEKGAGSDQIDYIGSHTDTREYSSLSQSTRLFDDSAIAADYMSGLAEPIDGCSPYESTYEYDGDTYSTVTTVTAAPQLDLPDSVAAIGWVEDSENGRYYVYDLQVGNLVVRSILSTYNEVTEQEFRDFSSDVADALDALTR